MKAKLNIITLGVSDFEKSVHFYEKGLGWHKSSVSQDDVAFFKLNGIVLSLYPREKLAEDITINSAGSGFSGVTIAYNATSEKEVDEIIAKIKTLDATVIKEPQKVFWGGYSSYFKDRDGFIFEVAYNPFLEQDENGLLKLPD